MRPSYICKISLISSRTFCISCKQPLNYLLLRTYMNKIKITVSSGEPCVTPHSAFKLPSFLWIYLVWVIYFLYAQILLADRLGSSTIHSHWRFLWYKFVVCSEFFWNVGHVDWTFKAAVCQCGALLLEHLTKMLWLLLLCWGWPSYIKHCVKLQYEYIFF